MENNKDKKQNFAYTHPILTFLLINFGWTWAFWLAAIPLAGQDQILLTTMVIVGGFGPALATVTTSGLRSGEKFDHSARQLIFLLLVAGVIFALITSEMTLTLLTGVIAGYASLLGGWVFSSALSKNKEIKARMASIFPAKLTFGWLISGLLFYPVMIFLAWGLSGILNMGVEYPSTWGQPLTDLLPAFLLTFFLTAFTQGGNEEPGWRGFLQPELEKSINPLTAALIVAVFWSLWHLPLYLNGFYPGDLIGGMVGGFIFRIFLSIFLAWFYKRSGGSLFLMIFLHTCFNILVNYLPTSDLGIALLWLVVVVIIIIKDKMWRKLPVLN